MAEEKQVVADAIANAQCEVCNNRGFDYTGGVYYTNPLKWGAKCRHCGDEALAGYDKIQWPGDKIPAKVVIRSRRKKCLLAKNS